MQKFSFSCTHVDNIKMNIFYICRSYVELSAALEQGKELNKEVGDSINDQDLGIPQKIVPEFVDKIHGCTARVGEKSDLGHPQTHDH